MRVLHCSYPDLLVFPADYVPVLSELLKEERQQQREAQQHQRQGGRRR